MSVVDWLIDKAAIFTDLTRRNALRKANGLPLLDLRTEYAHQMWLAKRREYWAACDEHADEREAIRRQVLVEFQAKYGADFPGTTGGHWMVGLKANRRFSAYMEQRYGVFPPQVGQAGRSDSWHMDDGANALIPARPSISTTLSRLTTLTGWGSGWSWWTR